MDVIHQSVIVRSVADSYLNCIRPDGEAEPIDLVVAREQHDAYVAVLEDRVERVIRLDADERYPDCCFVEDPAIVIGGVAVMCEMGASARRGEGEALAEILGQSHRLERVTAPATVDGGDVVRIDNTLYVGLTDRTNARSIEQLREILSPLQIEVVPVNVRDMLHLKSGCSYIGDHTVVIDPRHVDPDAFSDYEQIVIPVEEGYASNCLLVNGTVVVSAGYPRILEVIAATGREVVTLEMSEFRKGWGSLTCLSLLLE